MPVPLRKEWKTGSGLLWIGLASLVLCAALGQFASRSNASDDPTPTGTEQEDNPLIFRDEREVVPPLKADLLKHVTDSAPLPILPEKVPSKDDKPRYAGYLRLLDEYESYCDAAVKAHLHSASAFATSARKDLTYAHLFNEPRKYRGQVVHFEGKLKRIRRFDPPLMLTQAGVRDLYEGWIFTEGAGANPVCLVFTELPQRFSVAEDMDQEAAFDGYFFKKYRYKAGDSKPGQAREVPLLIGHAPVSGELTGVLATQASTGWSTFLVLVVGVFAIGTLTLAIGLHWWFRNADNQVRRRLDNVGREFVVPAPEGVSASPLPKQQNGNGNSHSEDKPAPSPWREESGLG